MLTATTTTSTASTAVGVLSISNNLLVWAPPSFVLAAQQGKGEVRALLPKMLARGTSENAMKTHVALSVYVRAGVDRARTKKSRGPFSRTPANSAIIGTCRCLTFAQAKVSRNALDNAFFYVGCSQTSCDSVSGNDVHFCLRYQHPKHSPPF